VFNDIALHNFSHWNELAATIFEEYTCWPAYWDHWLSVGHEFWNCKHPLTIILGPHFQSGTICSSLGVKVGTVLVQRRFEQGVGGTTLETVFLPSRTDAWASRLTNKRRGARLRFLDL
jgi:hypothetical protein